MHVHLDLCIFVSCQIFRRLSSALEMKRSHRDSTRGLAWSTRQMHHKLRAISRLPQIRSKARE